MVDVANLTMTVGSESVKKANADLDKFSAASEKASAKNDKLTASTDKMGGAARKASTDLDALKGASDKVTRGANEAADAHVKLWQSVSRQKAAYQELRATLDPVYASSKRYESAVEQINSAISAGVISQAEANRTLALAENAYLGAGNAALAYAGKARAGSFQTANLAAQFNDIGMMLAAGQSPLMLALQQGTQVSQVLNTMGGWREILTGLASGFLSIINPVSLATIGIIAGGAALGQWAISAWGAEDASKKTADAMDDLSSALGDFNSMSENAQQSVSDLIEKYGQMSEQVRQNFRDLAQLASLRAIDALQASVQAVGGSVIETAEQFAIFESAVGQTKRTVSDQMQALAEETGMTAAQARAVRDALQEMSEAKGLEQSTAAAQRLGDHLLTAYGTLDAMPAPVRLIAENALNAANSGYELKAGIEGASAATAGAVSQTQTWANTMAGVRAEIEGIMSAMGSIGGGLLSSMAKRVELDALQAGKSLDEASRAAKEFKINSEYDAKIQGAGTWFERQALQIARSVELSNVALDSQIATERKAATEREKATKKSSAAVSKEVDTIRKSLGPIEEYNKKLSDLVAIKDKLTAEEFATAVRNLNVELADNLPVIGDVADAWGDFAVSGFRDFESFKDAVLGSFRNMLSTMIATAAKNRIIIGLGLGGGVAGTASAAGSILGGGSGGGGGSGLLGSLGGNLLAGGGFLGGIGAGASASLGIGGFSSAGLFNIAANAQAAAATGAGALSSTIGAALPAIGIAIAGVMALRKALSREFQGSFLRGDLTSAGFSGNTQDFYNGGFLAGDKTVYGAVPGEIQTLLDNMIGQATDGLREMAGALDLDTKKMKEFVLALDLRTNDKTPEQIQEYLIGQIGELTEGMADLILTTDQYTKAGETSLDVITRLSTNLTSVNDVMNALGHSLFTASLHGAGAASHLVEAFGSIEALQASTAAYFEGFYTEQERTSIAIRELRNDFRGLGVVMPESRAQFRALIEGIDTSTASGRELYAGLMQLSSGLNEVLPQVMEFTNSLTGLMGRIGGEVGELIEASQENERIATQSAQLWYRTAETLRDFLSDLLNSDLSAASSSQQAARNASLFNQAIAAVRGGDVSAAQNLPQYARNYLTSARSTASTSLEYRRIAAQVQNDIRYAAGVSEIEGANDDVLAGLYRKQIEVLTSLGNFLELEGLTGEQLQSLDSGVRKLVKNWDGTIDSFETALAGLETAIAENKDFSIENLEGRLDVIVALGANSPKWVKRLVNSASDGMKTTLDFVIRRDDLTPDLRWIAVNEISNHVADIEFALVGKKIPVQTIQRLVNADGSINRDLVTKFQLEHLTGIQNKKVLNRLVNADGSINRDLDIGAKLKIKPFDATLLKGAVLAAQNVSHTIRANLKGDVPETIDLIRALNKATGESGSKITIGGGVKLSADEAFQAWYSTETKSLIATPMEKLGNQLDKLRVAMEIERINELGSAAAATTAASFTSARDIVSTFTALRNQYGVGLVGQKQNVTMSGGIISPSFDYYSGTADNLTAFKAALRATFGTDNIGSVFNASNAAVSEDKKALNALRRQVRALGGIPAFARGVMSAPGGAALVGEYGPEVVDIPQGARVYSNRDSREMLDNSDLVEILKTIRDENAQLGIKILRNVKRSADTQSKWDAEGIPPERT